MLGTFIKELIMYAIIAFLLYIAIAAVIPLLAEPEDNELTCLLKSSIIEPKVLELRYWTDQDNLMQIHNTLKELESLIKCQQ